MSGGPHNVTMRAGILAGIWAVAWSAAAQAPEPEPFVEGRATAPLSGEYEVLEAPGFVVHYQNCDGTLPTADRLTLPRRLSSRYSDMTATVRAELHDGEPANIELVAGDEPLLEAIHWHVERARFAPGEPACVTLHYEVVETVVKASEVLEFRVWVDATVGPDGSLLEARLVDELDDEHVADAIRSQVATWTLEPSMRDGQPVPRSTSLRVGVRLQPTGWTTFSTATSLVREGPRPVKTESPPFPKRLRRIASRGVVVLEFMVSEDGEPFDVSVVSAEPKGIFERHAVSTIKRWRYQPAAVGGTAVISGPVRQAIQFNPRVRPKDPFSQLRINAQIVERLREAQEAREAETHR